MQDTKHASILYFFQGCGGRTVHFLYGPYY